MSKGVIFLIRPGKKAEVPVYIRVRFSGKDYLSRIPGVTTAVEEWPDGKKAQTLIRKYFPVLGEVIAPAVEELVANGTFNADKMAEIIENATSWDERERARAKLQQAAEEKKRLSVLEYYDKFLKELRAGIRKTDKGVMASERTITNYQQGYNRLSEFQTAAGRVFFWEDINRDFLNDYVQFLQGAKRGEDAYNTNTCAKRVKEVKHLVRAAREDKVTSCPVPEYKFGEVAVDSVYLSWDELKRFANADLRYKLDKDGKPELDKDGKPIKLSNGYQIARDLFLVGCYCGQRVSDYANIKADQIHTDQDGRVYISVLQKKTGARVEIPARKELRAILNKYNNNLPRLTDQVINRYIKEVAKRAGIDETIEIRSTKGGKVSTEKLPKYELVTTHTARRSAATLMYLDGVDSMDIRAITGHSSDKMLMRYIRSSAHDNARTMAKKSSYWD